MSKDVTIKVAVPVGSHPSQRRGESGLPLGHTLHSYARVKLYTRGALTNKRTIFSQYVHRAQLATPNEYVKRIVGFK